MIPVIQLTVRHNNIAFIRQILKSINISDIRLFACDGKLTQNITSSYLFRNQSKYASPHCHKPIFQT
jgi:hypothetical protein